LHVFLARDELEGIELGQDHGGRGAAAAPAFADCREEAVGLGGRNGKEEKEFWIRTGAARTIIKYLHWRRNKGDMHTRRGFPCNVVQRHPNDKRRLAI